MKFLLHYLKPRDWILFATLTILTLIAFVIMAIARLGNGSTIRITVDGKEYGQYALTENQEIPIISDKKTCNVVKIENGAAFMLKANCPDHLCMHQGKISSQSQSIVCLPNHVVVTVEGNDDGIDSMVK